MRTSRRSTGSPPSDSWLAGNEQADIYLAVHSLHHVVELEHLYDEVARSLHPDGVLLVHPESYVTFANVIDPFIDRIYGPNFDPDRAEDTTFIESVARLDDARAAGPAGQRTPG